MARCACGCMVRSGHGACDGLSRSLAPSGERVFSTQKETSWLLWNMNFWSYAARPSWAPQDFSLPLHPEGAFSPPPPHPPLSTNPTKKTTPLSPPFYMTFPPVCPLLPNPHPQVTCPPPPPPPTATFYGPRWRPLLRCACVTGEARRWFRNTEAARRRYVCCRRRRHFLSPLPRAHLDPGPAINIVHRRNNSPPLPRSDSPCPLSPPAPSVPPKPPHLSRESPP
mmetsp:Transcript_3104/g.4747  ORF Transcript_3104/g.4747 Transcript_3104/m.4747 type:complete len:224 (-) Transcript_3104:687-1358(-)